MMTKWEYEALADLKARKGGERVEREGRETENGWGGGGGVGGLMEKVRGRRVGKREGKERRKERGGSERKIDFLP